MLWIPFYAVPIFLLREQKKQFRHWIFLGKTRRKTTFAWRAVWAGYVAQKMFQWFLLRFTGSVQDFRPSCLQSQKEIWDNKNYIVRWRNNQQPSESGKNTPTLGFRLSHQWRPFLLESRKVCGILKSWAEKRSKSWGSSQVWLNLCRDILSCVEERKQFSGCIKF